MQALIDEVVAGSNADHLEVRIEDTLRLEIVCRGREVVRAQETRDRGGYVRALVRGAWGFVSFTDPDRLRDHARRACELAAAAGGGRTRLARCKPVQAEIRAGLEASADPTAVPVSEKVDLMQRYARELLEGHEKIVASSAAYSEVLRTVHFGNSRGARIRAEEFWAGGGVSATGRDGNVVQSLRKGFGTRSDWGEILAVEAELEGLVRDTVELLGAEPVRGGRYTVILDPRLAAVFVHEAFGHLSEADNVAGNRRLAEQMRLGARFGREILNIVDAGNLPGERGSFAYDDEGTPSSETYLIRDGLLAGRLHSLETAGAMHERPTGNARTISYRFPPICRMSNTFIAPGESSFEGMLGGVEDGLYVVGGGSGNTSTGLFTFAAERARVIRGGRFAGWVRDLMMTGDVFETLMNIDMVGNDLYRSRSGGCGKSYGQRMQYPLMVSMGSPHIRIRNLLIGGR